MSDVINFILNVFLLPLLAFFVAIAGNNNIVNNGRKKEKTFIQVSSLLVLGKNDGKATQYCVKEDMMA